MPVHQLLADDDSLPVPSLSAVFRLLGDGGVLFSAESEVYFGVNALGARIWELLPPVSVTTSELCAVLASQYPDVDAAQLREDVRRFLDDLIANGLVTATSMNAGHHPAV
jgi:coenzyme PQQ synthesis protein D (PqqD)